jgi:hypothetical protein
MYNSVNELFALRGNHSDKKIRGSREILQWFPDEKKFWGAGKIH